MATEEVFSNTSASPDTGGSSGIDKAAGEIERIFGDTVSEPEPRQPPKKSPEKRTERDAPELQDDDDDEEDLDDVSATPEKEDGKDDEEGDEEDEDDKSEAEEDPEVDLGEEKGGKVKMSELKAGYERQADYTRKTTELAEEKKVVYGYASEMKQEREALINYAQELNALAQSLQPDPQTWAELRKNPAQFLKAQEAWGEVQKQRQSIIQAAKDALQSEANESQRSRNLFIQDENRKLKTLMPAIFDKVKGPQIQERIYKYGERAGYSRDELAQAVDSRDVMTLWKAMRYDEIKKGTPEIGKPAQTKPAPQPVQGNRVPQRPQSPQRRNGADRTELSKAQSNLRRSGSVEDAAQVMSRLFK